MDQVQTEGPHRSKFSRTLILAPGICESLDYITAGVGLTNTLELKKTKQNVSGVPVITKHIQ
jgi:hypothetical protein